MKKESLSREEKMEILRGLTLFDDGFFASCFSSGTGCTGLLLRAVLGRDDIEVLESRVQASIPGIAGRGVRLDALARDRDGTLYDIEVQRDSRGAERRRARHCSAMLDSGSLPRGSGYDEMPESYVIFITEDDVMKGGLPRYSVERCIMEREEAFGDGSHIVYVNGRCRDGSAIGRLMHDFSCADPGMMHNAELAGRVRYFKETEEGIEKMSSSMEELWIRGKKEGLSEGEKKGYTAGRQATARRMLADGSLPISKIAEYSGLSLNEVEKLRSKM